MWQRVLFLFCGLPLLLAGCGGGGGDGPRVRAQAQALQFGAAPALTVGEVAVVQAQASSALPVVYASRTPTVCGVDPASGAVSGLRAGPCTVEASQSGNADWAVASPQQLTLSVQGQAQALQFDAAPRLQVSGSATVGATASSGLAPAFSSLTPAQCSVDAGSGTVLGLAKGRCTLAADQAGDATWAAAPRATLAFEVQPLAQTIALEALPAELRVGAVVRLRASASSGLPVALSSLSPAVCALSAGDAALTGLAAGTCVLAADQPGDALWAAAARMQQALAVAVSAQTLSFGASPGLTVGGTSQVTASASSGLPVRYSSLSQALCSVHAQLGTVTGLREGACRIAADQAGDGTWAPAAQAVQALAVSRRTQVIGFEPAPPSLTVTASAQLQAVASSGLPVGYASLTPTVCAVQGGSGAVSGLAAGTCSVSASQPGDATWAPAAPATRSLPVVVLPQFISFAPAAGLRVTGTAVLSASASSGLAVTFSSLTPAICAVDAQAGVVSGLAVGACTLAADQPGGGAWAAALQASQVVRVDALVQQVGFGPPPTLVAGQQASVHAAASSGLAVTYSSLTPGACGVQAASGRVDGLAAGTCTIAADQPGNAVWGPAPQARLSFAVAMDPRQSIAFGAPPPLLAGGTATVQAAASSGLPVRYASLTPAVCTVDADTGRVAGLAVGLCTVSADQPGNGQWTAAAQARQSFPVAVRSQLISFGAAPVLTIGGSALAAASASSGLPVAYSSLTPGVCSVQAASGRVTALAAGTCTIAANQAGNATWATALQATQGFHIDFLAQHIGFGAAPVLAATGSAAVQASASSGLPLRFSSLSAAVCAVHASSGLVTGLSAGTCTIAADQAGNAIWSAAATVTQRFAIAHASQSIRFGSAPALAVTGQADVSALASSGLPVAYSSLTPGVCTVGSASGRVSALAQGSCAIAADQAGDAVWSAAPTATQRIAVARMTQSIVFASAPALTAGSTARLSAAASSGLAVVYASLTPAVCGVQTAGGVVTGLIAGTCTIGASQGGNAAWAAAPAATLSFAVAYAGQSIGFASVPTLVAGATTTLSATASSGLPLVFASLTPAVCTIDRSSALVNGLAAGACTVSANQGGNAVWAPAAQVTLSFAVSVNPVQTLRFAAAPALTLGGTASVSASASSGLPVSFTSLTPGVCGVSAGSGLVTDLTLGDCVIAANQAGNATYHPAAQATLTLPVQVPPGVTVPAAPTGVAARLGSNLSTVIVSVGGVASGGNAITGYTVVSSPPGITATAATAPVTVTCPSGCAGYAFAVLASNGVGAGLPSSAVPVLTVFDVLTTFREPDTQPRDTVFTGSLTLNSTTGAVSNLNGQLTESMSGNAVGSAPYYDMTQVRLAYQLQSWRDAGLGGTFVASFAKNSTSTFTTLAGGDGWSPAAGVANGGIYAGFPAPYRNSLQNTYVLIFVPDNPFASLTTAQLDKLAYADCAPGGMMGAVCMTATSVAGYGAIGTMSGFPLSQLLVRR